jgi:hypothetical protein
MGKMEDVVRQRASPEADTELHSSPSKAKP